MDEDDPAGQSGAATPFSFDLPFTRRDLLAAGHSRGTLRRHDFVQVIERVWIQKAALDRLTLIRAALLVHPPTAFASHLSAAAVHALPVPDHGFAHVTVTRHADRRFRAQIKPHVTERERRVVLVQGIRTTDPIATFIDCAGWLSLVELVILGDALCRRFRIKASKLLRACRASTDYYSRLATAAAELVRDGVDSPMETRLRLLIVLAGLPEPVVNFRVHHEDGTWKRRFDLYYPTIKVIIEYDGRHHAESVEQWNKDVDRREEFDDEGYRILVVTARGIFQEPGRTLERIRTLLIRRGMEDVALINDLWREHFAA
ncbi:endonuclease domain-containing protein [Nocardioides dongxiaopingii]|uniref:endonuclease domain-containing protein n=1 Tax=Nocardioides dongxiaopingii TaxID=2576036 RepID=UPI0010C76883|nr:DUF559 domain-containing protein [Nocardioides dongxiaopingii]